MRSRRKCGEREATDSEKFSGRVRDIRRREVFECAECARVARESRADTNIDNINTVEKDGVTTTVNLILNVHDRTHLARVIRRLRTLPQVLRISRRGS